MTEHRLSAMIDQLAHHEVQLQVRDRFIGGAADESPRFGEVGGQHAAAGATPFADALEHVPGTGQGQAEQVGHLRGVDHHHHIRVVVQVGTDTGQVTNHRDAVLAQVIRRPDAREHEQLRGPEGTGTEHDLAPGLEHELLWHTSAALPAQLHTGGAHLAITHLGEHPGSQAVGEHLQVAAAQVRGDIGLGGTEALAVAVGHLIDTDAFLLRTVEIVVDRVAGLATCLQEVRQERVGAAQVHHIERSALAVPVVGAALVVLGTLEVRQHVLKRPARVALGRPVVVVARMASGVDHGVDRTRPAHHLAARLVAAPTMQPRLRHGVVTPAVELVLGHHGQPTWAVDEDAAVGGSRLDEGDSMARVLAQASRQGATGRSSAHDDGVVHVLVSPGRTGLSSVCKTVRDNVQAS